MKSAEELIEKRRNEGDLPTINTDGDLLVSKEELVDLMQEYAREALKEASDKATVTVNSWVDKGLESRNFGRNSFSIDDDNFIEIDKSSITDIELK